MHMQQSSSATSLSGANLLVRGFIRFTGIFLFLSLFSPASLFATTYYLAPAANGGSDSHNGLSSSSPWLTPKHNLNCGDVILAKPSSSYASNNFNSGRWGNVSCPSANNVAWLQCETFDACKIWSTSEGINVDHSFWGVQGWEVTVASGNGFCFGAAPSSANWVTIHHIIFANNVANKCQAGGFVTYPSGKVGVDYVTIIGNIAYDAIQGGDECYNGISIYEPVQSDWKAGTHIYVADNIAWGNFQPDYCGGVKAWGGDGIIFDTFDGSQSGLPSYDGQTVAKNNIVISNGGHGIEVQNNVRGSSHAPIYLEYNTSWNNEINYKQQVNHLCAEVLLNSAYNVQEAYNLVATSSATQCAGNPIYALSAYTVNSSVSSYENFAYGYDGRNTTAYATGGFAYSSNNTLGQYPYLHNAYTPGAPYCSGTGTVANCMSWLMTDMTAEAASAASKGHQWPGNKPYDPLFPAWVCNVGLPEGLIAKGC